MANVFAIHSVGESIRTHLDQLYPADLRVSFPCEFRLLSSGELDDVGDDTNVLSLYLYRVTINEHLRNTYQRRDNLREDIPLPLDLHYLITVWSSSALAEQTILSWTMRQLYLNPVLNQAALSAEAGWGPDEVIEIIPAELTNEDMMRIWDSFQPNYRLSFSYIARVVLIRADSVPEGRPVVATRFSYQEMPEEQR